MNISYINSAAGKTAIINNGYAVYLGGPYTGSATIHLSDYGISSSDYGLYSRSNFYPVVFSYSISSEGHTETQNSPSSHGYASVTYDSAHGVYTVNYTNWVGNLDGQNEIYGNVTFYGFLYVP